MQNTCSAVTLVDHRYLKDIQDAESEPSTQGMLDRLLGDKIYLGQQINKLLLLEAAVYD